MKNFLSVSFIIFLSLYSFSQEIPKNLNIESYTLKNGLTVYLNEDHTTPSVLGAVIIKTGGKFDPADATGTSHYLEHMLFKGTDKIGTVNYEEEKVYLDSIAIKYDELALTTGEEQRKEIQKQINALSLKAGEYAIPNELDKFLDQIGSTSVNAFTSEEMVAYYNVFPSNQMEKWLYIYSNRFINPVFRLFQSELETVFEEKNMYSDNMMGTFIEKCYEAFYKNHPYGTQTILGSVEHIKNPSLTNMKKMYDTYYVANNMALVLTGNFNTSEVKPYIERYFSKWKSGEVPEFPEYAEEPFNGAEVIKKRLTPVKVGIMGYRTIPANHNDEVVFEVCEALLNNGSSTGYLDKLNLDGKVLAAFCFNDIRNDHGAFAVIYIPKIIGQSLKKARNLVSNEILRLKTGDIDNEFFESVKLELIKDHQRMLENSENRGFMIAQLFTENKTWEEIILYPDKINNVSIDDVKRVAEKYLGNNYLSFESKMGFPKKDRLEKPGFDPVIPENAEVKSKFAEEIEKIPVNSFKANFVDFNKDLEIDQLTNNSNLYYVENEINDIFNLKIKYQAGILNDTRYEQLADYMALIGTQNLSLEKLNEKLQKIGASLYIYAMDNYFVINVNGFDKYLGETIELISQLLHTPKPDDSKLKILNETDRFNKKYEKTSPDELSNILLEYGMYGEESKYLTRLTKKEMKELTSEDLLNLLEQTLRKPYNVHYSGTVPEKTVYQLISDNFKSESIDNTTDFIIRERINYLENTILLLDDPKALQSKINFYVNGNKNDPEERAICQAFNNYFGSGMSSLVFQEIREFRSLSYAAYANYMLGLNFETPGYLRAFVGTQSDKTIEAIQVMDSLISQMPEKENRMPNIKSSLLQSLNGKRPEWRRLSESVELWMLQGYDRDPREIQYEVFKNMEFDQIIDFYQSNIKSRSMLITIVGNKKQIDLEKLKKYGEVIEVKQDQIKN